MRSCPATAAAAAAPLLLVLLLISSFWTAAAAAQRIPPSDPSYYDLLRTDPTSLGVSVQTRIDGTGSSNVVEFVVSGLIDSETGEEGTEEGTATYDLADITSLLPYTIQTYENGNKQLRRSVPSDSAALLLAIHHFNNAQTPSIIASPLSPAISDSYKNCRIRLTTELFDTGSSPIQSTRTLTTVLDRTHTPRLPLPATVLGAYRSASTSPTAILSGVNSLPQLSYRSSSTDFDDKEQYPLFGRTVPSSATGARAVVDYLVRLKVEYVGVVFVTDAFGSSYQKSLQDAAGGADPPIRTDSVSFSYSRSASAAAAAAAAAAPHSEEEEEPRRGEEREAQDDEIAHALSSLRATQYRYFVALIGEEHCDRVLTEAARQGLVGPEYVWILVGGVSREVWQGGARYEQGSALAEATNGIALIQVEGGPTTATISAGGGPSTTAAAEKVATEPSSSTTHDRFRSAWSESTSDPRMVDYIRAKQPGGLVGLTAGADDGGPPLGLELSPEPTQFSYFIWDAVQSLGFGMCMAERQRDSRDTAAAGGGEAGGVGGRRAPSPFIAGPEIYANFTNDVAFEGASGRVEIDSVSGTRRPGGVTYTVWNARSRRAEEEEEVGGGKEEKYVVFDLVPTSHYVVRSDDLTVDVQGGNRPTMVWAPVPGQPFLYNDGTATQPTMLPPPDVNMNYIGTPGRIVGYVLMGIVMALSIVSAVWTGLCSGTRVVQASQPLFLALISVGCLVMSSAIVPLSMEETTVQNADEGLDRACMAAPWIYVLGFAISFAALFAKTWSVNKVYKNPSVDSIVVRPPDLLRTLAALLVVNVAVLLTWTLVSPLEWERMSKDSQDSFDRTTETYATCTSDNALPFVVVVIVVNLGALLFANWLAYQARDVQTEYQESRYIAISMASILQAWCMGIPIMIVVKDSPQARFFVEAGIIFVTCTAVLLLVFIPKAMAVRTDRRKEGDEQRRNTVRSINARAERNQFDEDEDEPNPQAGAGESSVGGGDGPSQYGASDSDPNSPVGENGVSPTAPPESNTAVTEGALSKDGSNGDGFQNEGERKRQQDQQQQLLEESENGGTDV